MEETAPEVLEAGVSKVFARNRAIRLAAERGPVTPRAGAEAARSLEERIRREADPSYRSVLEAELEKARMLEEGEKPREDAGPEPKRVQPGTAPAPPAAEGAAEDEKTRLREERMRLAEEKIALRKGAFMESFQRLTNEAAVELAQRKEKDEGYLTKTQAALAFIPTLEMVQPAIVQSFSLRNFFQAFNPNSDPADVRARVASELAVDPIHKIQYGDGASEAYDLRRLSAEQYDLIVDAVTQERLADRWWHTRADLISLDIGLAHPDIAVGTSSRSFERRVDGDLPEFLFGGGIHLGSLEASVGAVLFREPNDEGSKRELKAELYFSLSISIYQKHLQLD